MPAQNICGIAGRAMVKKQLLARKRFISTIRSRNRAFAPQYHGTSLTCAPVTLTMNSRNARTLAEGCRRDGYSA
jgi:hypothetical protein